MKRQTLTTTVPRLVLSTAVAAVLASCGGGGSGDGTDNGRSDDIEEGVLTGSRDVNGDGVTDISVGDIDLDGFEDFDIDGDGTFDTQLGDQDFDGRTDFDTNGDRERDFDVDGDGTVDRSVLDEDGFLVGYSTDDNDDDAELDIDGAPISTVLPVSAENPCGSANGTDNASANDDWSDNCTISRANQHARSTYTAGIQRVVWCSGFDGGSTAANVNAFTDGSFGAQSQAAVEAFQAANGLTGDGIVGAQTWAEMRETMVSIETADSTDLSQEFYGVEGALCSSANLFIANNSGAFEDSALVIDSWDLTQGEGNQTAVEFGVQTIAVD